MVTLRRHLRPASAAMGCLRAARRAFGHDRPGGYYEGSAGPADTTGRFDSSRPPYGSSPFDLGTREEVFIRGYARGEFSGPERPFQPRHSRESVYEEIRCSGPSGVRSRLRRQQTYGDFDPGGEWYGGCHAGQGFPAGDVGSFHTRESYEPGFDAREYWSRGGGGRPEEEAQKGRDKWRDVAIRGGVDDPFAELGVSQDANWSEIRTAHRAKAMEFHPDRSPGNEEQFRRVTVAYNALRERERNDAGAAKEEEDDDPWKYEYAGNAAQWRYTMLRQMKQKMADDKEQSALRLNAGFTVLCFGLLVMCWSATSASWKQSAPQSTRQDWRETGTKDR
eukprot:TRINITY_DN3765_c4_g1_i1.p1 TRINITY_DN3765_c4_g1~~TRINITY_DN3765_c4_g1_i1.p1  ORF type:complete len:335 (+),score=45.31 TRINITY_DN3765_c4_g1_i1:262-1266(+)